MCNPVAIGVMSLAATGIQASSAYQTGKFNSAVAEQNQAYSEIRAEDALERGEVASQQHREKVDRLISSQRAAMSASGVEINTGSALDLMVGTREIGERDIMTIENNAQREAWGHRVQGANYAAQGSLDRVTGINNAAGTILGGTARSAYQYRVLK